jgi:hypothetical protein
MSLRNKLAEAMTKGIELERQRCLGILVTIAHNLRHDLNRKLMTTAEKHTAEVKFGIASAVLGAAQIKILSGEQPDAFDRPKSDAVRRPQGDEDGGRAS